jgi:hypothetical protein
MKQSPTPIWVKRCNDHTLSTETGKLNIPKVRGRLKGAPGWRKRSDPKKNEETTSFLFIALTNLVLVELLYFNPGS